MRCRLLIMLMMAVVISNGFLAPSAQAEKSAEFDFWFEKVDPATGKGEKASISTLDDYINYVTVVKNSGTEYISTVNIKRKHTWKDVSVEHVPRFAMRLLPNSIEWEREWEVNLKPGEEKRIEEGKSNLDWIKFEFSLIDFTLVGCDADNATITLNAKLGPFTIKGMKVYLADSTGLESAELFIDENSLGEKSCEYKLIAKAD